jgi:hypothetical protein
VTLAAGASTLLTLTGQELGITSGAATDGQVPTANGAGGVAWETSTMAASDLTTRYEPLTNGDAATPELVFLDGDVIMAEVEN